MAWDIGFGRLSSLVWKQILLELAQGWVFIYDTEMRRYLFISLALLCISPLRAENVTERNLPKPTPPKEKIGEVTPPDGKSSSKPAPLPEDQKTKAHFAAIEYDGGSWKLARNAMEIHVKFQIPNFLHWLNEQNILAVSSEVDVLRLSDNRIFNYPMLYLSGHYDFSLSDQEKQNLKSYLELGGFLYVDYFGAPESLLQQHGRFSKRIEETLRSFFPDGKFELIPKSHIIFKSPFPLPRNKPAVIDPATYDPEKDDVVPLSGDDRQKSGHRIYLNGFYYKNRMMAFYSDAGTNSPSDENIIFQRESAIPASSVGTLSLVTHVSYDPDNPSNAFKLGANILTYLMTH